MALFGTFAAAALLLALVESMACSSFITTQRTQEIGIRMALGANRGQVMWMVLRQALVLALMGVAVGLPLAWFAGRFFSGRAGATSQHDPLAFIAAICILPLLAVLERICPRAAPPTSIRFQLSAPTNHPLRVLCGKGREPHPLDVLALP